MRLRIGMTAVLLMAVSSAYGQVLTVPPAPECESVVIIRCDEPAAGAPARAKQDAAHSVDSRRAERANVELDRVIIESEAEQPISPEQSISLALARPLVQEGETSYSIGESAQCTCRNICPPPPLPCCSCSDRSGSRLATPPGWKPTD